MNTKVPFSKAILPLSITISLSASAQTTPVTPDDASTIPPPVRVPKESMGITQLSNKEMAWFLNDKFGMFIHWGLYSGPGKGEWYMENAGILPDAYRTYAFPESENEYFDAANYNPEQWAQLAKDAGMKWMCLTARHHDGFSLFDSPHPNAFDSVQTLRRDLFAEYVKACRGVGLKVGFYYSPLSWRYPGYYDVTGTHCVPNKFGYTTDASHKENARLMKEENYVNIKKLLTSYGRIDHIYWDGGWLGQQGSDADGAFFHEPGKYLDPTNQWPISSQYLDLEKGTAKPLGIMGMVRKYQPHAVTNLRYGWIGDILEDEGPNEIRGPIRNAEIVDKNLTMQVGPSGQNWGYNTELVAAGRILTRDDLIRYLADCVTRNMTFLVNVTPDRHGVIPDLEKKHLLEMGAWMKKMGDSIYGTRGGPWNPVDGKYGYTYKGRTVFVHLLESYEGQTFKLAPLGPLRAKNAYDVFTGKKLSMEANNTGVTISGIDRDSSKADSVIAVVYDRDIASIWKK